MRTAARTVIGIAADLEKSGNVAEGIRIRRECLTVGSIMQSGCNSLIGSLVGVAISSISATSPAGEVLPTIKKEPNTHKQKRQSDQYLTFLERNGAHTEGIRFRKQLEARSVIIANSNNYSNQIVGLLSGSSGEIYTWWVLGLFHIEFLFWMAVTLSIFGTLQFVRTSRERIGKVGFNWSQVVIALVVYSSIVMTMYHYQSSTLVEIMRSSTLVQSLDNPLKFETSAGNPPTLVLIGIYAIPIVAAHLDILISLVIWLIVRKKGSDKRFVPFGPSTYWMGLFAALGYLITVILTAQSELSSSNRIESFFKNEKSFAAKTLNIKWPPRIMPTE